MSTDDLHDALEIALLEVLDGSPWGPLMVNRIRRVSEGVLRQRGQNAVIQVLNGGRHVRVGLREGSRVREFVLTLEG